MELINSDIIIIKNRNFPSNTYLIKDNTKKCIVIDPGLDSQIIADTIDSYSLTPLAILSTHGHFDHIGGVSFLKNKYNIPFYIHAEEIKNIKMANFLLKLSKLNIIIDLPTPDFLICNNNEVVSVENFELSIYKYPGHSCGSCIFQYKQYLFTGDIIYKNGLGINNSYGEDTIQLKSSLIDIINKFDDNCVIYPGHGSFDLLKNIKKSNKELASFIYH